MHLPQSSARQVAHFPQLQTFFPTVTFTGLGVDDLSLLARIVASFFSKIEGSSLPELNETVMVEISLLWDPLLWRRESPLTIARLLSLLESKIGVELRLEDVCFEGNFRTGRKSSITCCRLRSTEKTSIQAFNQHALHRVRTLSKHSPKLGQEYFLGLRRNVLKYR